MSLVAVMGISVMLAFSFKLIEITMKLVAAKDLSKYSVYVWAAVIVILAAFFNESYSFKLPDNIKVILPAFFTMLLTNLILSRSSGYNPIGKFYIINFIIVYPIIEELVFRGLILPLLSSYYDTKVVLYELLYLPVTAPAVIISAFLFAVAHLQYYKLSMLSVRYMFFAFLGGLFFGGIAEVTHSILIPCILHIQFNALAVYYAKKTRLSYSL